MTAVGLDLAIAVPVAIGTAVAITVGWNAAGERFVGWWREGRTVTSDDAHRDVDSEPLP